MTIIDGDVHISPHPGTDRIGADEALRRMDRAGVDKAICWLQPHYSIPEVEQSNAYIHQAMQQHPDRFLGFGWANPHLGIDKAKDTIRRCLYEYGMYGIKLNGNKQPIPESLPWLDDSPFLAWTRALTRTEHISRAGLLLGNTLSLAAATALVLAMGARRQARARD